MNTGRFYWLQKAGRQTDRDTIAVPHLASFAGNKTNLVRFGQLFTVEIGKQQLLRRIIVDIFAGIDEAISGPVLERDAPLPAGIPSGCTSIGSERRVARAR